MMTDLHNTPILYRENFSYDNMENTVEQRAREIAVKWRKKVRDSIFELGADLLQMKQDLPHGSFRPYVENEIGISMRMAQLAMTAAENVGSKSEIVSHLPVKIIHLLSAKSTPAETRDNIIDQLEAGESPSPTTIEDLIKQARYKSRVKEFPSQKVTDLGLPDKDVPPSSSMTIEPPNSTIAAETIVDLILPIVSSNPIEVVRLLNLCTIQEIAGAINRHQMSDVA